MKWGKKGKRNWKINGWIATVVIAIAMCCVGVGNTYAISGGTAGSTSYVNTTSSNPKGIHNIGNPSYSSSGSRYNYVYFGRVPSGTTFARENFDSSVQGTPILWRVLNTTANDDNGTEALFMLTEYALPTARAWDEVYNDSDSRTKGQIWDNYYATAYGDDPNYGTNRASTVRAFLQGNGNGDSVQYGKNGIYQKCFSSKEQGAILTTVKTSETMEVYNDSCNPSSLRGGVANSTKRKWYKYNTRSYYAYGCPLNGDTIFLLSAEEARNQSYGFQQPSNTEKVPEVDSNRICKQNSAAGEASLWWLRSPLSNGYSMVAVVNSNGAGTGYSSDNNSKALRFALNLQLSSVIFTSPVSVTTSSITSAQPTSAPYTTAGSSSAPSNASKLTIYDSDRSSFTVSPTSTTVPSGGSVEFTYSNATSGDYITALLYDNNTAKSAVYYGSIQQASTGSGNSVTFNLPSLSPGSYTLKIMTEQINESGYTNYAGYTDIALTIQNDTEDPVATNVYTNADKTYYKLTLSDDIALGSIKNSTGSSTLKDITALGTGGTVNVATTAGTTALRVYDAAGNYCDVNSTNMTINEDSTPPIIESVTYNNGEYIIQMRDVTTGLWKITDKTGLTILEDYTETFPSTATYECTVLDNEMCVYDGVGNVTLVSLKKEISEDTVISGDELGGIKVLSSCKITFSNSSDITVGSVNNPHAGIEVVSGATLTIESTTNKVVNIYGGHGTDSYGSTVKYAGINVPTGAIVNMQAGNTIKAYGYGVGNATGAGIGGNGVTLANASSVASANAGTINISSGTVYAYGGYASDGKSGTGAGIGGGGVYNNTQTSLTAGKVTNIRISGGTIYAYGGSSSGNYATYGTGAGIGGGGVWDNKCTGNLVGGHVDTISISNNSTVDAIGGFTGSNTVYGSGAGIGGGGVYHESTAATITGGSITSGVSVSSTNSTRGVGGYCSTSYEARGTGAGIGGGGVYSKAGNNVAGGSVASATFTGSGTVIVKGGFGSGESKATGAHIGGGGVYTENNATNVTVGELSNLRVSDNASINTFSLG